jgi:hypothetical protein
MEAGKEVLQAAKKAAYPTPRLPKKFLLFNIPTILGLKVVVFTRLYKF